MSATLIFYRPKGTSMKNIVATIMVGLVIGAFQAQGQSSPIFMKVNVADAPSAGKGAKQLEIALTNTKTVALTNLVVEYWIISRDVETKEMAIAKTGKETVSLRPTGRQTVTSLPGKFTFKSSGNSGSGSHSRSTPPTGTKFYGYGVAVSLNDKVINEQYDPKELKMQMKALQDALANAELMDDKQEKKKR
jgi:hypothetical protein